MREKRTEYFKRLAGSPQPVVFSVKRRVSFSEVDVMGIVWFGRYSLYFEEAQRELGRRCGLSYQDFYAARLSAPIVEFHTDYYRPLYLDEEFSVKASLVWSEGAKIYTEYLIIKEDKSIATFAYTVQLLIDAKSKETCIISPELLERMRKRWLNGELDCQK